MLACCMTLASALPSAMQVSSMQALASAGTIASVPLHLLLMLLLKLMYPQCVSCRRAAGGDYLLAPAVRPHQQRARGRRLCHGRQRHGPRAQRARPRAGGLPGAAQNLQRSSAGRVVNLGCGVQESPGVRPEAVMLRRCTRVLQLGLQHGLEPFSPVDDAGCFTAEAGAEFQGLAVLDEGNAAVIQALERAGALLKVRHNAVWMTDQGDSCSITSSSLQFWQLACPCACPCRAGLETRG